MSGETDGEWLRQACAEPSSLHRHRALERQRTLTKPAGSLGHLESLACELAGMQSCDRPQAMRVPILVFAGDHGVTAQSISAYPAEVTVQMLHNFANGGAAISVLAKALGQTLRVIDVGTRATVEIPGVQVDKPCPGTADFSTGAAMSEAEVAHALSAGRRAFAAARDGGIDVLVLGEMGIGNTTAASALACALDDFPCVDLVGSGTGLDALALAHKRTVVEQALTRHRPLIATAELPALEALRRVGGLEIAALTGAMLAAAQHGTPVLVDGFIVSVAALTAVRINPAVRPWLLFSHRSAEQGHAHVLHALDARPLLQLGLRLGEGSGAALAIPLLQLACALHNGMATFAQAAVSDRAPALQDTGASA